MPNPHESLFPFCLPLICRKPQSKIKSTKFCSLSLASWYCLRNDVFLIHHSLYQRKHFSYSKSWLKLHIHFSNILYAIGLSELSLTMILLNKRFEHLLLSCVPSLVYWDSGQFSESQRTLLHLSFSSGKNNIKVFKLHSETQQWWAHSCANVIAAPGMPVINLLLFQTWNRGDWFLWIFSCVN